MLVIPRQSADVYSSPLLSTTTQLAELIEDEEELAEIDTSNIVWTGRRRNAPLDYSSEEALKQAGLDKGSAAAEQEEDDAEFHVSNIQSSCDAAAPSSAIGIAATRLYGTGLLTAVTCAFNGCHSGPIHRAKKWTTNDHLALYGLQNTDADTV